MDRSVAHAISGIVIAGSFILGAGAIHAQCTCAHAEESPYGELKRSAAVFVGKAVNVKRSYLQNSKRVQFDVTFKLQTAWKGDFPETLTVRNVSERPDGSDFEKEESYLVYAFVYEHVLSAYIGCCTRTKQLSHSSEDLEDFKRNGEKPKTIKRQPLTSKTKPNKTLDASRGSVFRMKLL